MPLDQIFIVGGAGFGFIIIMMWLVFFGIKI